MILCRCGNTIDLNVDLISCVECIERRKARRKRLAIELRERPWNALARSLEVARKHNLSATITLDEWLAIYREHEGKCAYCNKTDGEVIEHKIPISRGGGTTKENVVPSCVPCNMRKGKRTPEEWRSRP